jgi:hypothetical protein
MTASSAFIRSSPPHRDAQFLGESLRRILSGMSEPDNSPLVGRCQLLLHIETLAGSIRGGAVLKQATDPLLPALAVMSSLKVVKFGVVSYGSNCPETEGADGVHRTVGIEAVKELTEKLRRRDCHASDPTK